MEIEKAKREITLTGPTGSGLVLSDPGRED